LYYGICRSKRRYKRRERYQDIIAETWLEPIRNPVTGKAHRAIIEIPEGFESSRMDQASMKALVANDGYLNFDMKGHMVVFQKILGKDPNFKGWDILLHYVIIIVGYTYFQVGVV
jgi:hypothetical protein